MDDVAFCVLEDFATLRLRGADARRFLQGQLSNDLNRLQDGAILRAGLHNPQGRTLALLWLASDGDDVLALLPRDLADTVITQLRRFILRARVSIDDESGHGRVIGCHHPGAGQPPDGFRRLDPDRAVAVLAAGTVAPPGRQLTREQWRALDIERGQPQVYAATSGHYVAQMLNLDCIDAVSFQKGCYTGQEVIARAHFRGRVKRRLQRFAALETTRLAPGEVGHFADGRSFGVIEAVSNADGRCEFLAVAPLPGAAPEEAPSSAAAGENRGDQPGQRSLSVQRLPLPYALPE